ncbi:MAG: hypothetical protein MJA29_14515, partial [Candidatus Omnitrophica bacterium]|nr:hypothetical protein [Candidatus Omnitrophota bacterium]
GMDTGRISTVSFIETPGVTNIVTAPQIQSSLGAAGLSNVGTQVLSPQLVSPQQAFNPAPLLPALGSIVTNIDELASQLPPTMELETRVLKSQMVQLQSTPIGEMGPVIAALDTTLNMLQPVGAALMIEDVTVLRKQIVSIGDQLNVPIGGTPQINQASDLLVSFRKVALPGEGLLMVAVNDGRGAQLLGEHTFTIPSGATGADLATAVTNAIPQAISTISGNLAMDTSLINTVNFIESPGVTGIVAAPQLQDSLVDAGLSTMNAVVLPAGPGSAAAFTPAPIISSVSSPLQQRVEAFSNTLNDIANQLPATMMDTQLQLEALAGQLKTTELGLATVLSAGPGVIGNMLPAFETAVPEFVPVLTGVQAGLVGLQQEGKVPELPAFVTQLPGTPNIASTITPGLTDGQLTLTTSLVSADTGLLSTQSMQVPLAATAELTTNAVLEQIGTMVPELSGKVGLEAADIGKMQMSVADSVAEKVKFSQPQMTTALSQQGLNTVTEIVSIEDIQDSMLPASEAVGGIDLDIGALLETMGDGAVPVFSNVYFDLSRFAGFAAEVEVNPPAPSAATAIRP